jgi:hypothetical protein
LRSALSCRSPRADNGQPAQQPAQQQQQQGQEGKRRRASLSLSLSHSLFYKQCTSSIGLSNSKIISRQGPPEVPSNSKINPQTPSRTEIENLINYLKMWSRSDRSDRDRTVYDVAFYNFKTYCHCATINCCVKNNYTYKYTMWHSISYNFNVLPFLPCSLLCYN